jgi:hypothetical protein
MKKLFSFLPILTVMMVLTAALAGCGASKEEEQARNKATAIHNASAAFQRFVKDTNSKQAEADYANIVFPLQSVELKLDAVPIEQSYIDRRLHDLYLSDAANTFQKLRETHGDPQTAKSLGAQYAAYMNKAVKDVPPAMEKQLALNIARNEVEHGHAAQRAHGVNPNPPVEKPVRKVPASKASAKHK